MYSESISSILCNKHPVHFESHIRSNAYVPISNDAAERRCNGLFLLKTALFLQNAIKCISPGSIVNHLNLSQFSPYY